MKCDTCEMELGDNGFTRGCAVINCPHDEREFYREVEQQKAALTLPLIERIAHNEMPACFGTQRQTLVALADLLMQALQQNEELVSALQADGQSSTRH